MKIKLILLALQALLVGVSANSQSIEQSNVQLVTFVQDESLHEGSLGVDLVVLEQSSSSMSLNSVPARGGQKASGTYEYRNGQCHDGVNVVPIYNCYYFTMEVDLGLTDCLASNAICYYDVNGTLVDAYPVNCKPYCMN